MAVTGLFMGALLQLPGVVADAGPVPLVPV
jgi:hypothetical protein